jgi:hypothetical protein
LNLAPVIILDFAGQEVFYSTHQSFLTHQGIYVLVINGSLNLDKEIPSESFIPGRHGKPTTITTCIFMQWAFRLQGYIQKINLI